MDTKLYESHKKENTKHLFYIILLGLLTYLTFYFLLRDLRLKDLVIIIKDLNIAMCILGLLSSFLFIACESLVFKRLLSLLGEDLAFMRILKYSTIGFYFSSITPSASGGQPMQLYYMKKDKIDISKGSLTVLISLFFYQVIMLSYASVSIVLNWEFIVREIPSIFPLLVFGFIANLIVMTLIIMSMFSSNLVVNFSNFIIRLLSRLRIIKDVEKFKAYSHSQITQYKEGARIIRKNPTSILYILLVTFIQHSALYAVSYFVYRALGLKGINFWKILGLQAVSHIASSSIPLPGSVGVSETASILVLKKIFPANLLSSAILIIRIISFYIMIIVTGIFTMAIQFIYGKRSLDK